MRNLFQAADRPRLRALAGNILAVLCALNLVAATTPGAEAARRDASLAIDANTGAVLHAQAADEIRYPASLTKMMTLYLAFSEIEAGRLSYATQIRVSEAAAAVAPSKLGLEPGEEISLIDAMKALVTKSANDMAVAIAEHIAGSEEKFARVMTERARMIGMRSTVFRNASGLPDPGQVTTARDMLTLALRIHDEYPKHYRLFSLRHFTFRGDTYRNHNSLLFHYPGTEGMKTGYTRMSGFNLVTSVKRDGKHVVAAVFGGSTAGTRNAHMRAVLNKALVRASPVKTRKPAPMLIAKPKVAPRPAVNLALKAEPQRAQRPQPKPAAASPAPAAKTQPQAPQIAIAAVRPASIAPTPAPAPAPVDQNRPALNAPALLYAATAVPSLGMKKEQQPAPRPDTIAAPAASAPRGETETIISKTSPVWSGGRQPGTLEAQLAAIAAGPDAGTANQQTATLPRVQPVAPPDEFRPSGNSAPRNPIQRGKPPSTLAAQAAQLTRMEPSQADVRPIPTQRLGGPPAAAGTFSGPAEIEIGTYNTVEEAESRMEAAQAKFGSLAGRTALALPVAAGTGMAYRARFTGFDGQGARAACAELVQASVTCRVTAAN